MAETTQFFLNNRQLIKGLGMNTSSTSTPTYTSICSTSEVSLDTDFEEKVFFKMHLSGELCVILVQIVYLWF